MITTDEYFDLASLAEASYALFSGYSDDAIKNAIFNAGLSQTQTNSLVADWGVIVNGHQTNTASGFSSTLFQNKHDGSYVLAFRGTEPFVQFPDDLGTDIGDIVSDGLAFEQIIDMHNEWLRITSPGVYTAAKLETLAVETLALQAARLNPATLAAFLAQLATRNDVIVDMPTGTVKTIAWENSDTLFNDHRQTGLGLAAEIAANGLTVTGHSLGGHLASAFTRLFPETYAEALTINGAGFGRMGLSGFAAANVNNVFSMLHGEPAFYPGAVHTFVG